MTSHGGTRPRLAIIGSKGIPARYGGFESFIEGLAPRLVESGWDVTVYCRRGKVGGDLQEYRGVHLVSTRYIGSRSLETLSHELTAFIHSLRHKPDVYYVLGTRAAPVALIGRVTGRPVVMHTDGLEWARRKWGRGARAFLRFSEWLAARGAASHLVADAEAMASYYRARYGKQPTVIPYGVDIAAPADPAVLAGYGLAPGGYDLVVCRLEPENNVDLIIRGYLEAGVEGELAVVGGAAYGGAYQRFLKRMAVDGQVRFLGPIYDGVDHLYAGSRRYLHGHEVGGMNPSLLRAMGAGAACFALDTPFNREALGDTGVFWSKGAGSLPAAIRRTSGSDLDALGQQARQRASDDFSWDLCRERHLQMLKGAAG